MVMAWQKLLPNRLKISKVSISSIKSNRVNGAAFTAEILSSKATSKAVAVVAKVVGKHVVPGVGQVLVLDHEVDFDRVEIALRLAEVPRVPGAAHWQSVVE